MPANSRSQRFLNTAILALTLLPLNLAAATTQTLDSANTHLAITADKGSELQLEVRDTPLAQVLNSLAQQLNIPIHYSVLPKNLVTATCVGPTIKQLLACLIAERTDIVFRHSQDSAGKNEIAEVWIMGSTLANLSAQNNVCMAKPEQSSDKSANQQTGQNDETEAQRADELLALAQSKNPETRATAIESILTDEIKINPALKTMLEDALADKNADVRAQAISTLAHLEGNNNVTPMLQTALSDESVDVRLMAVDGITDNMTLLNQAINDSDESVRSLATAKLEALTQN
ncbi:MAG: HEAT repeat domain-containing protein [Methylovulum sp.]|nr:HEAT repeat domain-containing protein [Methylovulum sp.]